MTLGILEWPATRQGWVEYDRSRPIALCESTHRVELMNDTKGSDVVYFVGIPVRLSCLSLSRTLSCPCKHLIHF